MSFIKYLLNWFIIPPLLLKVSRQLRTQKAFQHKYLTPLLQDCLKNNDGSISKADIRKIEKYYGLAVPAVLGEAYAVLRGKPMTERERKAATFLGATTGLFDDFFENRDMEDAYIRNLYNLPEDYRGNNDNERLANQCWLIALGNSAAADTLKYYAGKVHEAQIESRKQVGNGLTHKELQQITDDKGGYSVLFYRSLFDDKMPEWDEQIFYRAGALLQLENDLFDVYKDREDRIQTLVTTEIKIAELRTLYLHGWATLKKDLQKSPYDERQKVDFLKILAAIVSRGFVCLDMLAKLEKENMGHFDPSAFTRKQLICDMEKPVNLLKTLHYFAKIR